MVGAVAVGCVVWCREPVDFDAEEGVGRPAGEGPGDPAQRDKDSRHMHRCHERGQAHGTCKYEVAELPHCQKGGFVVLQQGDQGREGLDVFAEGGWRARSEGAFLARAAVGLLNEPGESDGAHESDDGEDHEGVGTNAADVSQRIR